MTLVGLVVDKYEKACYGVQEEDFDLIISYSIIRIYDKYCIVDLSVYRRKQETEKTMVVVVIFAIMVVFFKSPLSF